ncbi:MAG TPA: quinone-dependent dihydroorotate dehydrogenase [Chloroflexia bacterium]|nr:quinone-dependent dihydroorotate dehydrogenase [Chloroflexia bacterium]
MSDPLYRLIQPWLFRLEAEQAHELVTGLLAAAPRIPPLRGAMRALYAYEHPALRTTCAGLAFANPVGLAAGFDKRGTLITPLALLGFGFLEVGTVTPRPQPGNARPRLFRLPADRALINRLGFNSPGIPPVARRLRTTPRRVPLGINIGKNRDTPLERATEDYLATFQALAPLADYVAINISSPNTPGLRLLHERAALAALLGALAAANRQLARPRPLFLKVSPDETPAQLDAVVAAAQEAGIAGYIAGNTTLAREGVGSPRRHETGGLSGRPLRERARRTIGHLYRATGGRTPIIGVGGVASAGDAYGHLRAGATLVQLYTGLIYEGPGVARQIKRGLVALLARDGLPSVAHAVGVDQL